MSCLVFHSRRVRGVLAASVLLLLGCGGGDQLRLPTTEAELDAASARGDSLSALIAAGQIVEDSVTNFAGGQMSQSELGRLVEQTLREQVALVAPPAPAPAPSGGDRMTQRAQARGDSMARAAAREAVNRLQSSNNRSSGDTLRGVIVLEGSAPVTRLMLDTAMASMPVSLSGMATSELSRLEGLEVVVRGVRVSPRDLAVTSFTVRAKEGLPVSDGTLINDNGSWAIQLSSGGRRSLARVPLALQPYAGARVWIAEGEAAMREHGLVSRIR